MSIKTDAVVIRDETTTGANTATRVGTNLVDIADDLVAKQAAIDLNNAKVGVTNEEANPDVVLQAEAEAGVATTERIWTAERVKQAIVALGGSGSVDDTAYGISWNGVTSTAPSKNALYDFIESQVFKVDENSKIIPIYWGGTQAEYNIDFPSGHTSEYLIVVTDGVVPPTNASDIVFVPNGSIAATDVQAAIQEVRDEAAGGTMTDAEVKIAYENNADTNAFTDDEKVIVGNTSGTNTGDQVPTTGTGTAIDLTNVVGAYYNIGASSTATAFTVPTVAVGGFAVVQSASTTTEPTVTVTGGTATEIPSLSWTASTLMYLNIYSYDGTNVFYYWSDTVSTIPDIPTSGVDFDPVGTDNSTNVTLTTTGTGAATLVGQALNIPILGGTIPEAKDILNHTYVQDGGRVYENWVEREIIVVGDELIDGETIHTCRIPSVQFCSNGDLLMACEGRQNPTDGASAVVLLIRKRGDILLEKKVLIPVPVGQLSVRNPNMVRDNERIYMFYSYTNAAGTPTVTNDITNFYIYTDDNGVTWSSEIEILPLDQDPSSLFKYMVSPSNSIVHSSGDIIIPIWGKYVNDPAPDYYRCGIIVFDGTTFTKRLLDSVTDANESTIYEDQNTDIVMSCREGASGVTQRKVYRTSDFGLTWTIDASSGADSLSVYVNIKRYANELYRLEIEDGATSETRKNLNLYKSDLSNNAYVKTLAISEREKFIWGYGSSDNYLNRFVVLGDSKPGLTLYNVFVEDKGILNFNKNIVSSIAPTFYAPLETDGDDTILSLVGTNGGAAVFNDEYVSFDGTNTSFIEYADNDIFDFYDSVNDVDIPYSMSFMIRCNDINLGKQRLFLNKSGAAGTNRTWDIRLSESRYLRVLQFSELANSNNIFYETDISLIQGEWAHVIVSSDGNGGLKVYINNVLSGTAGSAGSPYVKMGNNTNKVYLGRMESSTAFNLDGDMFGLSVLKGREYSIDEREFIYRQQRIFRTILD